MDKSNEIKEKIIAVANKYKSLYYLDDEFDVFPQDVKDELKIAMVLSCEKTGGILKLFLDSDYDIRLEVLRESDDFLYDEIESKLALKKLEEEKGELFQKIQLFYKAKHGLLDIDAIEDKDKNEG